MNPLLSAEPSRTRLLPFIANVCVTLVPMSRQLYAVSPPQLVMLIASVLLPIICQVPVVKLVTE